MNTNALLQRVRESLPEDQAREVWRAYEFARDAHSAQRRVSGEPYIIHPCGVVEILLDLHLDAATLEAAFLHDVVEDTPYTQADIVSRFGAEVGELVEGVTKLDRIQFKSKEEEQAENFRKMFFAVAKDIRVLLIKLADRLHNMRTVSALPHERRVALATETIEIFAPLASRLGLSYMKCELEDLCLKVLHPLVYESIAEEVKLRKSERKDIIEKIVSEIGDMLADIGIKGEISGRPKHFYSIYKKMSTQNKAFSQIYDLIAVRVVVNTVAECYEVLGRIHTVWKPIPGRFKDYIAVPKPNNYQSLHTTVMTNLGVPFEIQIRTFDMHKIAEYGIAAHWMYKENKTAIKDFDTKINWLRSTLDFSEEASSSKEFLDTLKVDLYSGQVFVFTPRGDVVVLPDGSTPVDFAYSVHTDVGNKCVSAKINDRIVPLSTRLETGDYVEVITSSSSKGPSRDWLKFVRSSGAKAKIRAFFKKTNVEENIKLGKDMFEAEMKHQGYTSAQLMRPEFFAPVLTRFSFGSPEEMYSAVGYGGLTARQVVLKLIDLYRKDEAKKAPVIRQTVTNAKPHECKNGIIIKGFDDLLVRTARCCTPIPGDEIIGYVTRGRGVVVHRADCPNVAGMERERLIEATWASKQISLTTNLSIFCANNNGVLNRITSAIGDFNVSIQTLNARPTKLGDALIDMSIFVKNAADVDAIMKRLESLPDVKSVRRSNN